MIDPGAGARSERRSRDEMAKLTHVEPFSRAAVPPSTPWQDRKSPLLLAVEKQLFEIVQALIAAGADVDASDKVSST